MNRITETRLPSEFGKFRMIAYANEPQEMPHLALVAGSWQPNEPVLVRIHSECMTGDVFSSARCDCGEQLHQSMALVGASGGAIVYLRQEGRGIGLINKMKAYNLQDQGFDTAEANRCLGFEVDQRDFELAVNILRDLDATHVRLLTNNPEKVAAFNNTGIEVVERVPIVIPPQPESQRYLHTKQSVMGHYLNLNGHEDLH